MRKLKLFSLSILLICGMTSVSAAQIVWDGAGADDNWFTALNWDINMVPNGITTDVIVGAPSPVHLNGNVNINSLMVTADGVLNINQGRNMDFGGTASTTLVNLGTITTGNNTDFQLSGSVVNMGSMSAESTSSVSDFEIPSGGATLSGGGTITLMGTNDLARINGVGDPLLTVVDQTIQGNGDIGNDTVNIDLQTGNMIDANVAGQSLTVNPDDGGMTNAGTMQASGGGTLILTGSGGGTFDNTHGIIQALAGSTVELTNSANISQGSIVSTGDGQVDVLTGQNVFLSDMTLDADIQVADNTDFGISGAIYNTGTVQINSITGSAADIEIQSTGATLDGGGTITLSGDNDLARINGLGSPTLTIIDQTIQGHGDIGVNTVNIDLQTGNLIDANVAGLSLTVNPDEGGMTNAGTMQASGGGTLILTGHGGGPFDNTSGIIQALAGSTVELTNSANISQGSIVSTGDGQVEVLTGQNVFVSDMTLDADIQVAGNADFGFSGAIYNTGTVQINSTTGSAADIEIQTSGATLDGGGTITLSGDNDLARINGLGSPTLTIIDQIIQGHGDIGVNTVNIDLQIGNMIDANVAGQSLTVNPDDGGMTNAGTMQASGGGTLILTGSGGGTFDNTSGIIQALAGSKVELTNSANISQGSIVSIGDGQVEVLTGQNVFVSDMTLDADIQVAGNADFGFSGIINNTGTVQINSTIGSAADIEIQLTGATLEGGGTITLSGENDLAHINSVGNPTLTIADQTIQGHGNIGSNTIHLDFQSGSIIEANVAGETLIINGLDFTNDGIIRSTNGAHLEVPFPFVVSFPNSGLIEAIDGGTMDFFQGIVRNTGHTHVGTGSRIDAVSVGSTGGKVSGLGRINADLSFVGGRIAPGDPSDSTGTLTIGRVITMQLSSILEIELASATEFDTLEVRNDEFAPGAYGLINNGLLEIKLLNGFIPSSTDVFEIFRHAGQYPSGTQGQFQNAPIDGRRIATSDGSGSFVANLDRAVVKGAGDVMHSISLTDYQPLVPLPATNLNIIRGVQTGGNGR